MYMYIYIYIYIYVCVCMEYTYINTPILMLFFSHTPEVGFRFKFGLKAKAHIVLQRCDWSPRFWYIIYVCIHTHTHICTNIYIYICEYTYIIYVHALVLSGRAHMKNRCVLECSAAAHTATHTVTHAITHCSTSE